MNIPLSITRWQLMRILKRKALYLRVIQKRPDIIYIYIFAKNVTNKYIRQIYREIRYNSIKYTVKNILLFHEASRSFSLFLTAFLTFHHHRTTPTYPLKFLPRNVVHRSKWIHFTLIVNV